MWKWTSQVTQVTQSYLLYGPLGVSRTPLNESPHETVSQIDSVG